MAVPWFKVSIHVLTDARYRAVGAAGRGIWLDGMAYAATHRTDGALPSAAITDHKTAAKLVKAGLWSQTPDGWQITDYLGQHKNTPKDKIEAKLEHGAIYMAEWRKRKAEDPCKSSVSSYNALLEGRSQKVEPRSQKPEARTDPEPTEASAILAHLQRTMKAGV